MCRSMASSEGVTGSGSKSAISLAFLSNVLGHKKARHKPMIPEPGKLRDAVRAELLC